MMIGENKGRAFILLYVTHDLMHKHILFAIVAAVLLTAIVTVTLYTVIAAHAAPVCPPHCRTDHCICPTGQRTIIHPNPAKTMLKNMTNTTGGAAAKNVTAGAENATGK